MSGGNDGPLSGLLVLGVDPERPGADAIARAADAIRAGRLVAFPTETVYGLGADALDAAAAARIFAAKGRPAHDPLIVHLAGVAAVDEVAAARPVWLEPLAARFWPGPLTLIVPRGPRVPTNVTAGRDTVALRVPAHPVARALIAAAGRPIAAPSANLFARPSPTTAGHVLADLADRVDVVLDGGPTPVGVESTVLDLTGPAPRILRPGGVPAEALRAVLGDELVDRPPDFDDPRSPGTARRHYSPRAPIDLFDPAAAAGPETVAARARARLDEGQRVGVLAWDEDLAALPRHDRLVVERLGPLDQPEQAARRLFAALRRLDDQPVDRIVARMPPSTGLGAALRDRLARAADGRVLAAAADDAPASR